MAGVFCKMIPETMTKKQLTPIDISYTMEAPLRGPKSEHKRAGGRTADDRLWRDFHRR